MSSDLHARLRSTGWAGTLITCAALTIVSAARADDGRIEINQVRALAGGVSPTDTPGFPVTLESDQSYVLTGSLDAGSSTALFAGTAGLDDLTIDLNGFVIQGNGVGSGIGFNTTAENVEIKNGTIRGFGSRGLLLQTSGRHVVHNLRVIENGSHGIDSNGAALVTDCFVQSNEGDGIRVGPTSLVARNRVVSNGAFGIKGSSSTLVVDNLIHHPTGTEAALDLGALGGVNASGFRDNVINAGASGGTVVGGIDMGGNLCNGSATCP
jgi:hypothetical protein